MFIKLFQAKANSLFKMHKTLATQALRGELTTLPQILQLNLGSALWQIRTGKGENGGEEGSFPYHQFLDQPLLRPTSSSTKPVLVAAVCDRQRVLCFLKCPLPTQLINFGQYK